MTISNVAKCSFGRPGSCRVMYVLTVGHSKNINKARVMSSSSDGAISPASTPDVWSTPVDVSAEDTKQAAGRSQLCKSHSALQQCLVRGTVGSTHSEMVIKWKKGLNECSLLQPAASTWPRGRGCHLCRSATLSVSLRSIVDCLINDICATLASSDA